MKIFLLITFLSTMMWTGCSDDKENIVPVDINNIESTSTPGAIQLNWNLPDDYSTIKYIRVEYYDYRLKKKIVKLVSTHTTKFEMADTRAKYGAYEFTLQAFSSTDTGGEIHKITQVSEPAPIVPSPRVKVNLTAANLFCCHPSTTAGDGDIIGNLLDGNTETYFSTINSLTMVDPAHYLQVTMSEGITPTDFEFEYITRNHAGGKPTKASIWVSAVGPKADETDASWVEDGNWTKIADLSNTDANPLPVGNAAKYTSGKLISATPFKYFRLKVDTAVRSSDMAELRHFFLSEFSFYKYEPVVDPEAPDAE